jgi:hypothetical protein
MKRKILAVVGLVMLMVAISYVLPIHAADPVAGTCCNDTSGICYPPAPNPPQPNAYWRSDGKPCSAPR